MMLDICMLSQCFHIMLTKIQDFNSLFTGTLLCKKLIDNFLGFILRGCLYNITLDNQMGFIREG